MTTWSHAGFAAIASIVAVRTGLGKRLRNRSAVERATRRAMQRAGVAEPDEFIRSLAGNGVGWEYLIEEVTDRDTHFFRYPEQFEFTRTHILPALRASRSSEHTIRIWSAGCASGEETYSLALLLEQEGMLARAQVHGSDLCERAITRARAGRYPESALRAIDPASLEEQLRCEAGELVVKEALRTRVTFSQLNLADPTDPTLQTLAAMDLVFCRDVLRDFDEETRSRVALRLYDALAPGGFLVASPTDPVLLEYAPFERIGPDLDACYRRPDDPSISAELSSHAVVASEVTSPEARAAQRVRAAWREAGASAGLASCDEALRGHVLCAELHYLRGAISSELGAFDDAAQALRRCLYLDRSMLIAHFALGTLLERSGDEEGASAAFRSVIDRGAVLASDSSVRGDEAMTVGRLTDAASSAWLALEERRTSARKPY